MLELNRDNCFPRPEIIIPELEPGLVPDNWEQLLIEQIVTQSGGDRMEEIYRPVYPGSDDLELVSVNLRTSIRENFRRHFGPAGPGVAEGLPEGSKQLLIENLKYLYTKLIDNNLTANKRSLIAVGLTQELHMCTPGYFSRTNEIISDLHFPTDLTGLISLYRKDIVEKIARVEIGVAQGEFDRREILVFDPEHTLNDFSKTARNMGFGVAAINEYDVFNGGLPPARIEQVLEDKFNGRYSFFKILSDIKQRLDTKLTEKGYVGKLEQYPSDQINNIADFVKLYCQNPEINTADLYILNDDYTKYQDINWNNIKSVLIQNLINLQYFNTGQHRDSLDYITRALESEQPMADIRDIPEGFGNIFSDFNDFISFVEFAGDTFSSVVKQELVTRYTVIHPPTSISEMLKLQEYLDQGYTGDFIKSIQAGWLRDNFIDTKTLSEIFNKVSAEDITAVYNHLILNARVWQAKDLNGLIDELSTEQVKALFSSLTDRQINRFIGEHYDLLYLSEKMPNDKVLAIIDTMSLAHKKKIIKNSNDLNKIILNFKPDQRGEILNALGVELVAGVLSNNISLLHDLLDNLDNNQKQQLLNRLIEQKRIADFIYDLRDLKDLLSLLNKQQAEQLLSALGSKKLSSLFKEYDVITNFLDKLSRDSIGPMSGNRYDSPELRQIIKTHKFNLTKVCGTCVAVGVIGLGLVGGIGITAAIAVIPGVGLIILGIAAGVCAAASAATLAVGSYNIYKHKKLANLEQKVCIPSNFKFK